MIYLLLFLNKKLNNLFNYPIDNNNSFYYYYNIIIKLSKYVIFYIFYIRNYKYISKILQEKIKELQFQYTFRKI